MTTRTIADAVATNGRQQPTFAAADGGFTFRPATKEQAKARIALTGPSGSGKTFTALITATAMARRVALIDTERGSASKYAGRGGFSFDKLEMYRHDPRDLVRALAAAGNAGYDAVIVDSLTHFWSGTGGMLDQVDAAAKRGYSGNTFAGWKDASPIEKAMIDALVSYPGHLIVTMRVKTEWVIDGKTPRKVGMRPEQRAGIEYEFDVVGDLDHENTMIVSKTRCPELNGAVIRRPDAQFAQTILTWLEDGDPADHVPELYERALLEDATYEDLRRLYAEVERRGLVGAAIIDPEGQPTTLGNFIKARGTHLRSGSSS